MTSEPLRPLPFGNSNFQKLRDRNRIYVDKTEAIARLIASADQVFLARPRRFGKSLLVSTLAALFRDGLKPFEGLAIEKLWKDRTYPVVRLDFSELKTVRGKEEFAKEAADFLATGFAAAGFRFDAASPSSVCRQLSLWLSSLPPNAFVLLIDEYDAPLAACLTEPELFAFVRDELFRFYAVLKPNEAAIRFFFITGITKFSKESLFSELNGLRDITLSPEFGELLGFTRSEIERDFSGYVTRAAKALGMTEAELMDRLEENYGGYCFDALASSRVLSPWAVISFFSQPEAGFRHYWIESGASPRALLQYIRRSDLMSPAICGRPVSVPLDSLGSAAGADGICAAALLEQTGYLTIKGSFRGFAALGFPNKEVASSMGALCAEQLLSREAFERVGSERLWNALASGDAAGLAGELNRIFIGIDYSGYPIRDEASCRAMVQAILSCLMLDPVSERHNGLGRSDLEAVAGSCRWVFEFKFARPGDNPERLCEEAADQIREKRCGEEGAPGKMLRRLALVFSEKERQFVSWKLAEKPGKAAFASEGDAERGNAHSPSDGACRLKERPDDEAREQGDSDDEHLKKLIDDVEAGRNIVYHDLLDDEAQES